MQKALRFDSILIHSGEEFGPAGAPSVPIVQSSSFAYESAEALEDVAMAFGMAAVTTAVLTTPGAGDEIFSLASLLGGTFSLFRDTLSNYGLTAKFVDPLDLIEFLYVMGGGRSC